MSIAVLKKVRYALCPMPYALCPMPYAQSYLIFRSKGYIPHLPEKGYITLMGGCSSNPCRSCGSGTRSQSRRSCLNQVYNSRKDGYIPIPNYPLPILNFEYRKRQDYKKL